jgi:2-phospho-L-lactate transferase/gluconeogenesis factor (CofD/UPF0052 family)
LRGHRLDLIERNGAIVATESRDFQFADIVAIADMDNVVIAPGNPFRRQ